MERLSTNVVPPHGPQAAKAYFFGEAPGEEEDKLCQPFMGDAGQFMNRVLAKKGIIRSDFLFHNVFNQRPPGNQLSYFYEDKKTQLRLTWEGREHVERLRVWLEKVKERRDKTGEGPNVLVSLGKAAMYHLTGKKRIYKWRGSVLPCTLVEGFKVYPTLHPSHVMRTMQEEKVKLVGMKKEMSMNALPLFEIDMSRIKVQMERPDFEVPQRKFDVGLGLLELLGKLKQIVVEMPQMVAVDIETLQGTEGPVVWCVGFATSPEYAFTVPFIKKGIFAWSMEEEVELWQAISKVFLHPKILKVFQGGMYDLAILGRYFGVRCAPGTYGDTMYCHHASYPYLWKRLEILASIYTWEPYYKDEGRVNLRSRTDEGEFRYNCKDCAVTREIYPVAVQNAKELRTYEGYKRTMSILPSHLGMTLRGVRIDQEGKKNLSKEFHQKAEKYERLIQEATGQKMNLNSPDQKARLLYGYLGLPIQLQRGTRKPTTDKNALNKLKRKCKGTAAGQVVEALLEYQKFSKLASTYTEMRLDVDGRVRTSYSLTSTWRMNSSVSPFGGWTREEREGGNLQNIPVRSEEGRMVRRLFLPDEGKVLLCSDRKQAEAMFVAWDSQDLPRVKLFKEGWDIHWFNCKPIFGIPASMEYEEATRWKNGITGEEFTLWDYRAIGKTIIYAGYYGMGPYKMQEILALQGFIFEFKECVAFLELLKTHNPFLQQWQRDIREEVRATRTLVTPLGRKREFMGRFNPNLYNAAYAFKPQSTVGEITELTIQRLWEEIGDRFEVLMNVHDEVVGQCELKDVPQLVKDITYLSSYPILIKGRELDIPVDFKCGPNWADAKKVGG